MQVNASSSLASSSGVSLPAALAADQEFIEEDKPVQRQTTFLFFNAEEQVQD